MKLFLAGGKYALVQLPYLSGVFEEICQKVEVGIDGPPGFPGGFKSGQHSDDPVNIKA